MSFLSKCEAAYCNSYSFDEIYVFEGEERGCKSPHKIQQMRFALFEKKKNEENEGLKHKTAE